MQHRITEKIKDENSNDSGKKVEIEGRTSKDLTKSTTNCQLLKSNSSLMTTDREDFQISSVDNTEQEKVITKKPQTSTNLKDQDFDARNVHALSFNTSNSDQDTRVVDKTHVDEAVLQKLIVLTECEVDVTATSSVTIMSNSTTMITTPTTLIKPINDKTSDISNDSSGENKVPERTFEKSSSGNEVPTVSSTTDCDDSSEIQTNIDETSMPSVTANIQKVHHQ